MCDYHCLQGSLIGLIFQKTHLERFGVLCTLKFVGGFVCLFVVVGFVCLFVVFVFVAGFVLS